MMGKDELINMKREAGTTSLEDVRPALSRGASALGAETPSDDR